MTLKCHSSQVHYNLFHEDKHPQCVQHSSTSLFFINNDHSHCHCQPGFNFWQDFCIGLGAGIGNGLGGFMNSLLGCNFGFGMPMMGCFGNLYGGISMPNSINSLTDYNRTKDNLERRPDYSRYAVSYSKSKIETGDPDPVNPADKKETKTIKIEGTDKEITALTADDINKITIDVFNGYSDDVKIQIIAQLKRIDVDKEKNPDNREKVVTIAKNTKAPVDIVKAAREMLYMKGATNWNGKDEIKTIEYVTDTSGETNNVIPVPGVKDNVKVQQNGNDITIEITHFVDENNNPKTVTYTYVGEVNKYGEYEFKSSATPENGNKQQEYILQIVGEKFRLVQYPWHIGFEIADTKGTGSSNQ